MLGACVHIRCACVHTYHSERLQFKRIVDRDVLESGTVLCCDGLGKTRAHHRFQCAHQVCRYLLLMTSLHLQFFDHPKEWLEYVEVVAAADADKDKKDGAVAHVGAHLAVSIAACCCNRVRVKGAVAERLVWACVGFNL